MRVSFFLYFTDSIGVTVLFLGDDCLGLPSDALFFG